MAFFCDVYFFRTKHNRNGRNIYNSLEKTNLLFLNDGSSTRVTLNNKSVVDMTFVLPCTATNCYWSVHKDMGSGDYFSTIYEILIYNPRALVSSYQKRNLKNADWDVFYEILKNVADNQFLLRNKWKTRVQ